MGNPKQESMSPVKGQCTPTPGLLMGLLSCEAAQLLGFFLLCQHIWAGRGGMHSGKRVECSTNVNDSTKNGCGTSHVTVVPGMQQCRLVCRYTKLHLKHTDSLAVPLCREAKSDKT